METLNQDQLLKHTIAKWIHENRVGFLRHIIDNSNSSDEDDAVFSKLIQFIETRPPLEFCGASTNRSANEEVDIVPKLLSIARKVGFQPKKRTSKNSGVWWVIEDDEKNTIFIIEDHDIRRAMKGLVTTCSKKGYKNYNLPLQDYLGWSKSFGKTKLKEKQRKSERKEFDARGKSEEEITGIFLKIKEYINTQKRENVVQTRIEVTTRVSFI